MLALINEARTEAGLPVVVRGDNGAAQVHADDSLANCISSHWSIEGLTPDMRYTLAGGYQSANENVYGSDYCKLPTQGYSALSSVAGEVRKAMRAWMESPDHKDNILRPRQRKVNIGLAWDRFNFMAVQQFEGDYVEYTVLPEINDGVLSMEGKVKNGASLEHGDHIRVSVLYNPPPRPLASGQIARVYGSCLGQKAALLSYRSSGTTESTWRPCLSPYDVAHDAPAPTSSYAAHELWEEARARYESLGKPVPITVARVRMSRWELDGDRFAVSADLGDVLEAHGPGVYQVVLFGVLDGDVEPISEYSIFHGIPRPEGYDSPPTPTLTRTANPPSFQVYTAAWNRLDNAAWLEGNYPKLAQEIKDLPWVQDGIDDAEFKALREILYLAVISRPAVANILEMGWVRDGVDDYEAESLDLVIGFNDPAIALSITKLSWIQDGIDEPLELRAIRELYSYFNYGDPRLGTSVIRLDWLRDGITEMEADALDWLNSFRDSRVALMLIEQAWIHDGIDEPLEVRAIRELSMFDYEDPRLATSMTFDPDRPDLYLIAKSPEHMTYIWWEWAQHERRLREVSFDFTIHSDPGTFSDRNGLYLMVCRGDVAGTGFYFGLQTDVYDPSWGTGRGKGIVFSRWNERDLAYAKPAEGGWTQSSGHEGDFIGVRVAYEWGVGTYRMSIRPDGSDEDGEWYGVWLTDYTNDTTVWAGSLRFPYDDSGKTFIRGSTYTTLEIYGDEIRPIDIPEWYVSMQIPVAGDVRPGYGVPGYSPFNGQILNSDLRYEAGATHFRVGGTTERVGDTKKIPFQ